ncbi:hypothetical protein FRB99_004104 [Tulasnella sp. 403]|nr:hypothetical protein FRB99_004104 [Tulasnella sp. 403]
MQLIRSDIDDEPYRALFPADIVDTTHDRDLLPGSSYSDHIIATPPSMRMSMDLPQAPTSTVATRPTALPFATPPAYLFNFVFEDDGVTLSEPLSVPRKAHYCPSSVSVTYRLSPLVTKGEHSRNQPSDSRTNLLGSFLDLQLPGAPRPRPMDLDDDSSTEELEKWIIPREDIVSLSGSQVDVKGKSRAVPQIPLHRSNAMMSTSAAAHPLSVSDDEESLEISQSWEGSLDFGRSSERSVEVLGGLPSGAPKGTGQAASSMQSSVTVANAETPEQRRASKRPARLSSLEDLAPIAPLSYASPSAKSSKYVCGICQEAFLWTINPIAASLTPSSSTRAALYGLSLPCPASHQYCLDCMTNYIRVKLEAADGDGGGVFPIRCPECPIEVEWEMDTDTATKVLGQDLLDVWHFQKLLASVAKFYCPNPTCSCPIEATDDLTITLTQCPACQVDMCYKCKTLWHPGVSCRDNMNPPSEEQLLRRLANENHWRRCPKCKILVERTAGCPHMTCRCGNQFCHLCGARWRGVCTRIGGCNGEWQDDDTEWVDGPGDNQMEDDSDSDISFVSLVNRPRLRLRSFTGQPNNIDLPEFPTPFIGRVASPQAAPIPLFSPLLRPPPEDVNITAWLRGTGEERPAEHGREPQVRFANVHTANEVREPLWARRAALHRDPPSPQAGATRFANFQTPPPPLQLNLPSVRPPRWTRPPLLGTPEPPPPRPIPQPRNSLERRPAIRRSSTHSLNGQSIRDSVSIYHEVNNPRSPPTATPLPTQQFPIPPRHEIVLPPPAPPSAFSRQRVMSNPFTSRTRSRTVAIPQPFRLPTRRDRPTDRNDAGQVPSISTRHALNNPMEVPPQPSGGGVTSVRQRISSHVPLNPLRIFTRHEPVQNTVAVGDSGEDEPADGRPSRRRRTRSNVFRPLSHTNPPPLSGMFHAPNPRMSLPGSSNGGALLLTNTFAHNPRPNPPPLGPRHRPIPLPPTPPRRNPIQAPFVSSPQDDMDIATTIMSPTSAQDWTLVSPLNTSSPQVNVPTYSAHANPVATTSDDVEVNIPVRRDSRRYGRIFSELGMLRDP